MAVLVVMLFAALETGCGALLLVGGAGTSAIVFASGELRSSEEHSLADLDLACRVAIETLGYEEVEATHELEKVRWQARTVGGDPVDIRLAAKGSDRTELRIRVGVFGNEARSRLVLEQIHQSL
jgi:hypothetical protein